MKRSPREALRGIWQHMMSRCYDPSAKGYQHYGGRGIKVCEHWHNFENFHSDVAPRPEGMTMDRIDTNGGYGPGNFRWADMPTQIRNRRYTVHLTHNGETHCIADWAIKLGMHYNTLHERIRRGWPVDLALTTQPPRGNSGLRVRRLGNGVKRSKKARDLWPDICVRGHKIDPSTSRTSSSGKPVCKACERAKGRILAGWPEDLAYSLPKQPLGYRPEGLGNWDYKRRASRQQFNATEVKS